MTYDELIQMLKGRLEWAKDEGDNLELTWPETEEVIEALEDAKRHMGHGE